MFLALFFIAAIYIVAFQVWFLERFYNIGRYIDKDFKLHKWTTELRNRNIAPLPCGNFRKPKQSRIMTERSNRHMSENSIIIFTTFRNVSDRMTIQKNTINNWSQYRPVVQPVLFDDHTDPCPPRC